MLAILTTGHVFDMTVLTTGSNRFTIVDPCQILRWVLTRKVPARAFLIAHNHPAGDPNPSEQDIDATKQVQAAARVLQVTLYDHIILGQGKTFVSLASDTRLFLQAPPEYACLSS